MGSGLSASIETTAFSDGCSNGTTAFSDNCSSAGLMDSEGLALFDAALTSGVTGRIWVAPHPTTIPSKNVEARVNRVIVMTIIGFLDSWLTGGQCFR